MPQFRPIQISDNVFWVGAIDWELANFHGYATERGSTYNAYLVLADKITLIDTVKKPFVREMMGRINSVVHPSRIDYIVSNHSEMDHTGALPEVLDIIQPERIFASGKGVETINAHFHNDMEIQSVKDGDTLDLGNMNLSFLDAKMVHWPDSMFTYLDRDRILFTNDAFGMHLATAERFDDEIDDWILHHEAKTYFANILWPFAPSVGKVLEKVGKFENPIDIIAPDHGPVWRTKVKWILDLYHEWVEHKTANKAVVVYDTMWQSTALMARAIGEGLLSGGMEIKLMPLSRCTRSSIAKEALDAKMLVIGSPNLNSNLFPTIADILTYLQGLKPRKHKIYGASFGSYGWSPAAAKKVEKMLEEMNVEIVADPLQIKYVPDDTALSKCFEYGSEIAVKALGINIDG
ncbi:MAG: FprA family A-type flavoprotein [Candidatus Electryonea clarkiae]|nr:FprA family A-type flavoprotein [Candidatus Electryonea clarkiae]MDP8288905.1 FprA family A-type flavoprotein [Candidatus Electryonea clarkiae]